MSEEKINKGVVPLGGKYGLKLRGDHLENGAAEEEAKFLSVQIGEAVLAEAAENEANAAAGETNELTTFAALPTRSTDTDEPPPFEESSAENSDEMEVPGDVVVAGGAEARTTTLAQKLTELVQKFCDDASTSTETELSASSPSRQSPLSPLTNDGDIVAAAAAACITTENLLAILESAAGDDVGEENKENEVTNVSTTKAPAAAEAEVVGDRALRTSVAKVDALRRRTTKKYVYKLKSKTGKIIRYTSRVPIVLKKPVIRLTKLELELSGKGGERWLVTDDGLKIIAAAGVADDGPSATQKRERLSRLRNRKSFSVADSRTGNNDSDKAYASDATTDVKENVQPETTEEAAATTTTTPSSFGMQTRKRKLKFLPDGRLVGARKRLRRGMVFADSNDEAEDADIALLDEDELAPKRAESSDEDWQYSSDAEGRKPATPSTARRKGRSQKASAAENVLVGAAKCAAATGGGSRLPQQHQLQRKSAVAAGSPSARVGVDPARLLSTLIGVKILPSQLNVTRFKPKAIHKRRLPVHRKVTFSSDTGASFILQQSVGEGGRTEFFATSTPCTATAARRGTSSSPWTKTEAVAKGAAASVLTSASSKMNSNLSTSGSAPARGGAFDDCTPCYEVPDFENFTDSRTVKTRYGPKKCWLLKQEEEDEACQRFSEDGSSLNDLVQNVFERLPSWNLHVIPDTNTFCIAQVSRGRMGIPILKKSIELNSEFAAKIYVHQLHCKKFDGVYDTKSKMLSLIRDIDALVA